MKTNNMTSGNSMKQIVLFFLPLLFGNLFQQVYSLVDSIIVGKGIGDKALAAVGASGTLNFLILGFVVGLTRGFGISFSQSFGKGDSKLLRGYVLAAQYISTAMSILFTVLCLLSLKGMLTFLETPSDIFKDAYDYFAIILAGIIITVLNNLAITILQSLGDSKTPLTAMIISSITNIILDVLLVMGMHFGVRGAAIATVIAQAVSYIYCRMGLRKIPILCDETDENRRLLVMPQPSLCLDLLKIGLPVAFMNSVTATGGMILQYFVNLMGSAYVAAYSVCMKFAGLFEQFGISVGLAILTFVGQNKGAGNYNRIRKGVRQGLALSVLVNIPLVLIQVVIPGTISRLMLSDPVTIGYCAEFMPILGISLFALGWLFVFRYSVQGLGNTMIPMFSGFLEVAMRLGFGFTIGRMSFRGIAISEVSAWIGAFIMLAMTYFILIGKES
ncbi:MATE family efflux transporter [Butyrivibrio sp. XPD2002]|uniref:MATE family efflux transporter n=1 Tax=Butyrivibrio sp. XPD2002 TaxID=1280665 RepID=UPI0012DE257F|nr:MATE family efflux transporter [Butyrivibrio sp. XPD2002]